VEDSKRLNTMPGPAIIISASGMVTGGRILHHLKWRLPHARNAVLFVGCQAEGTRGRRLLNGAKRIRIHGQDVPVLRRLLALYVQAFRLKALRAGRGIHLVTVPYVFRLRCRPLRGLCPGRAKLCRRG